MWNECPLTDSELHSVPTKLSNQNKSKSYILLKGVAFFEIIWLVLVWIKVYNWYRHSP